MDIGEITASKAIDLLQRIHDANKLGDSQLAREVADLLGRRGDIEYRLIAKESQHWSKLSPGWAVIHKAVLKEAEQLVEVANSHGAGSTADSAMKQLQALAEQVPNI
jgi:hypothetical protein